MDSRRIASRIATEFSLAQGFSVKEVLRDYYTLMSRRCLVASDRVMYKEARNEVAFIGEKFFQEIADAIGGKLSDVVEFFKDSRVMKFFQKIGWSFKKLYGILREGYKAYGSLTNALAHYVMETGLGKKLSGKLDSKTIREITDWLEKHPKSKQWTGYALGFMLIYMWYTAAYIGDPTFDFDMDEVFEAFSGRYDLSKLFTGADGALLLSTFLAGTAIRLSFPWPGSSTAGFIAAAIWTLSKRLKKKVA